MSTPPNTPSRPLMRLVDLLGTRPDPERPRWHDLYMIVWGAALIALSDWALVSGTASGMDRLMYMQLMALSAALMLASSGASGLLLRRGNGALSRWFSILQALAFFPTVVFVSLWLYELLGVVGVIGWSALVVSVFCFAAARRCDRSGQAG